MPGYSDENGPPASVLGVVVTTLKNDDSLALGKISNVTATTSYARGLATIQWQNQKIDTTFVGTTAEYPQVEEADTIFGDFFIDADWGFL
jgi:hypothetical protein